MVGLGAQQIVGIVQPNQEEAEQRPALQFVRLLYLLLHQPPGGRQRIGLGGNAVQRHRHGQRRREALYGQAIGTGPQHGAQGIVFGHQALDRTLDKLRDNGPIKFYISSDIVQRRITPTHLVKPDVPLAGRQGKALSSHSRIVHVGSAGKFHKVRLKQLSANLNIRLAGLYGTKTPDKKNLLYGGACPRGYSCKRLPHQDPRY